MSTLAINYSNIFSDVIALLKPRISGLALITTAVGLYLAPGEVSYKLIFFTMLGVGLLVGGASALNMFLERDTDFLMERTKDRPIPQGRLSPEFGLGFGCVLVGMAIPILFLYVNPITGWFGVLSLLCYLMVYTALKRITWLAILIGAIPGAVPPLLGWTAATGSVAMGGMVLFGIIYIWQVPHFLAIGMFRKDDYAAAGLKVFPLHYHHKVIKWQMILFSLPLVPLSLMLYPLHLVGKIYFAIALGMGIVFLGFVLAGLWAKDELKWGEKVFKISLLYLTLLFIFMFVNGVRAQGTSKLLVYGKIPTFQLTNQNREKISSQDLGGKVWVADFVFTSCRGTCPMLTQRMRGVQKKLQEIAKNAPSLPAKIVSFSVDPERDTPEKLLAYANTYGADPKYWNFLTGPLDEVTQIVVKGFKISMGKMAPEGEKIPAGEIFDVVHGEKFVLVDDRGQIRGYYDSDTPGIEKLIADLQVLLKKVSS